MLMRDRFLFILLLLRHSLPLPPVIQYKHFGLHCVGLDGDLGLLPQSGGGGSPGTNHSVEDVFNPTTILRNETIAKTGKGVFSHATSTDNMELIRMRMCMLVISSFGLR